MRVLAVLLSPRLSRSYAPRPVPAQQREIPIEQLMSAPYPVDLPQRRVAGLVAWVLNDRGVRTSGWRRRRSTEVARYLHTQAMGKEVAASSGPRTRPRSFYHARAGSQPGRGKTRIPRVIRPRGDGALARTGGWGRTDERSRREQPSRCRPDGATMAFVAVALSGRPCDDSKPAAQVATVRAASARCRGRPTAAGCCSEQSRDARLHRRSRPRREVRTLARAKAWTLMRAPSGPRWPAVAFRRTPAASGICSHARTACEPWSIVVADAATGRDAPSSAPTTGRGSVYRDIVGPQLTWAAGDRLVFPWEKTGWTSLYSVSANGGRPSF